jgi:hypothetical protein
VAELVTEALGDPPPPPIPPDVVELTAEPPPDVDAEVLDPGPLETTDDVEPLERVEAPPPVLPSW